MLEAIDTPNYTLRSPEYANTFKARPSAGSVRPICKCGNRMFWDRADGEWECICGRREREWRK